MQPLVNQRRNGLTPQGKLVAYAQKTYGASTLIECTENAEEITCTPQDKQYGFTYFFCDIKAWKAGDEYYTNYLFQSAWSISSGV